MKFIPYFNANVAEVKIVPKDSSAFMKALGGFLDIGVKLKLTNIDKQSFMDDYTTTIGKTIYSNELTIGSRPSTLAVHELCHILQFRSAKMPMEYVCCPKRRAYYESESMQAELLCFPVITPNQSWISRRVAQLKDYGCTEAVARKEILARVVEVKNNQPRLRPAEVMNALLAWKALQEVDFSI